MLRERRLLMNWTNLLISVLKIAGYSFAAMIILLFVSGIVNSVKEAQDKNKKKWYFPCLCIVVGLFSFCQDRNSEIRTEEKISRLYEISQDAIEIEDLSYDELHERLHDIKYELDNFISDYYEQQPREDDRY